MTNIEMLCEGFKEIARNHGFKANVDYEEEGQICIYGGCNVPTLADVQMLCEDVHIDTSELESSDYGIDLIFSLEWFEEFANKEYEKGLEMWRRRV